MHPPLRTVPERINSDAQHDQREFDAHRPRWAVLSASPAVPALFGISHLNLIIFHVEYIQRAMLIANSTGIALVPIYHGWHDFPPS
jgi:hypothetical protein